MEEITFEISGVPIGKVRHRSTVMPNGMIHNYNTKKNTNYERLVKREYKKQYPNTYFIGELVVSITAYYPIPKSWSKKKKQEAIDGIARPIVKPDVDNVSKIILDSLNGVAFDDDKQVIELHIHKVYGENPRVYVSILGDSVTV